MIPGDFNGDGCVNDADLAILRAAFGSTKGQPNYNPDCDLNGDGLINSVDFVIFSYHYGECETDPAPTSKPTMLLVEPGTLRVHTYTPNRPGTGQGAKRG